MFTHQVTLLIGKKHGKAIECSSAEESELIMRLIELGERRVTVPKDAPLVAEVLPLVRTFHQDVRRALRELMGIVPRDIRAKVTAEVLRILTD